MKITKLVVWVTAGLIGTSFIIAATKEDGEKEGGSCHKYFERAEHHGIGQCKWAGARHERLTAYLQAENPEKLEELKKLREENPEQFRKEVKQIAEEAKEKIREEHEKFKEMIDKYRDSQNPENKANIRAKLEEKFKKQIDAEKQRVVKMEEGLKKAKDRLAKREEKMRDIVDNKVDEVIKDPDLKWRLIF